MQTIYENLEKLIRFILDEIYKIRDKTDTQYIPLNWIREKFT